MTAESTRGPVLPRRRWSFLARLSLAYAVVAAVLTILCVRVWQTSTQFTSENEWVAHTYEVKARVDSIMSRLGALQADATAYVAGGQAAPQLDFATQSPLLQDDLKTLLALVQDNPPQVERVTELTKVVLAQRDEAATAVDARRLGTGTAIPTFSFGQVRAFARAILTEEDSLLVQRRVEAERTATMTRTLTTVAIALSIFFLLLTFWLVRGSHIRATQTKRNLRATNAQLGDALAETQRISDSMQRLSQFGEMLQSCRSLDEVRGGVGAAIGGLLPDIGGRLALINASQNLAAIGAHWGTHGVIAESVFAPEDCWALRRGQAYPLAGTSGGFVCRHVHWPNPDEPQASYLCVPLVAQGEMIGVLTFDATRALEPRERRLAIASAEQLALSLANLRLQDTLRTQSIRDPLTGLFNRRYLEVSLERELLRASRRSLPLAVLMLDIDFFKRFNDSHGHEAGDALLAQFAEALKRATRSEDIICRYGGEEFTIVLLEADAGVAAARAENIRAAVAEMGVAYRQQQLEHVTVSIGFAVFPHDGNTPEELLRRADAALYVAKKLGRNRVASAQSSEALVDNPIQ